MESFSEQRDCKASGSGISSTSLIIIRSSRLIRSFSSSVKTPSLNLFLWLFIVFALFPVQNEGAEKEKLSIRTIIVLFYTHQILVL